MASNVMFAEPTEQSGFAFPASLTEKYRPRQLSDFVGLEKIRKCMGKSGLGLNFQRLVKESNNNIREALMKLETEIMCC